ncbi:hypothetical protein Tco_0780422, partial [Tanacetum coccineum]
QGGSEGSKRAFVRLCMREYRDKISEADLIKMERRGKRRVKAMRFPSSGMDAQVRGGYEYYGSKGRGVRRGMKRDRVTRDLSTPTQSPHSMSPVANSSRVVEANEEVPDTGDQESSTRKGGLRGVNLNKNIPADSS